MKQILARDMFIHARPTITKQYIASLADGSRSGKRATHGKGE